ncbi:hypothetical protein OJ997_17455 [Solirubrobacter phytolaccae]|uniref:Uncharacterized protein n=1 Tax=Solirubrobacter phytolaccae TaxID=1404360 RepID=A0A9X3NDJ4_9ACTN|nr:hypothetical protein [Solirubrobacter phytolaccae]MDA0182096.1 hypothetical protein [Solirubrobacter phytolaccae]
MLAALAASTLALTPAFGEAPLRPLPSDVAPYCVHATGVPGEVAIESETGARFLEATRTGYRVRGDVDLGGKGCPETAARRSGAGVAAKVVDRRLLVAVRDPGGGWSPPAQVAGVDPLADPFTDTKTWNIEDVLVAVAESGDAIVGWTEHEPREDVRRFRVARRAPGGAFGAVETIGSPQAQEGELAVGVASTGEAFALTATVEAPRPPLRMPVRVALAPRGGGFAAPVGVGVVPWRSHPSLAVADDGRALVTLPDGGALLVAEREPGAGFGAPVSVGRTDDAVGVRTRVALGAAGEAAVAWIGTDEDGVGIATRRAPGAFTPLVPVVAPVKLTGDPFYRSELYAWYTDDSPFYGQNAERLALTGDGHALLGGARMADVDRVSRTSATLAKLPLGGDRVETDVFGGVMGLAASVNPIQLADGTPALAWGERLEQEGTLRLAAPGATAPADPPPPAVTVGRPADRELRANERLVLPVRCGGPCELHAQVVNDSRAYARLRLPRGGKGRLRFYIGGTPIAPKRLGPVRIRLTYGRPDAQTPRVKTLTLRLVRAPEPPPARPHRVEALQAVRRNGTIQVSWRVRRPGDLALFFVTGAATREWSGEPLAIAGDYALDGPKRAYRVTLRPADRVRWVTLRDAVHRTRTTIPVR